jgi:hypothetical protein
MRPSISADSPERCDSGDVEPTQVLIVEAHSPCSASAAEYAVATGGSDLSSTSQYPHIKPYATATSAGSVNDAVSPIRFDYAVKLESLRYDTH